MDYYLTRRVEFEAAHYYRIPELSDEENYDLFGPTSNLNSHGHNYVLLVTVKGDAVASNGMLINIKDLDSIIKEHVVAEYDHKHINLQHPTFIQDSSLQPTSENIAIQVWQSLTPYLQNVDLHLVHLYEESTLSAEYYGKDQMVYLTKVYEFSASHRLHSPALTDEENKAVFGKCNNPYGHGHNYVLEVTIKGEVNPKTGMVADIDLLDRVIEKQVFSRFDHRHLNLDTTEFEKVNPTSENFVRVLWEIVEPHLKPVALHRLRLQETPKSYFDYYGDK